MSSRNFTCLVSALALVTASCAQDGSNQKEVLGTGIGAGLGGLIGSQFGHGSGKIAATIVGIGVGGFLGNRIGAKLDELDKQKATQATQQVLTDPGSAPAHWDNPQSGNSGTVKAEPVFYRGGSGHAAAAAPPKLAPPPANAEAAPAVWVAHTQSPVNLRAAPNASAGVVGHLKPNRNFQVLGKVPGSPWLIVGQNGQHVGYVSSTVVQPAGTAPPVVPIGPETAPAQANNGPPPSDQTPPPPPSNWGDNAAPPSAPVPLTPSPQPPPQQAQTPPAGGGMIDPGAIDRDIGLAPSAQGGQACRKTVSTIKIKGQDQPQVSEVTFCQQPDGNWAPVTTPT
ncbi:MAG TPA: SH3 domain-containing protein [Aliidongia sp.]|nr:SH3 domain-containing protein [Aliidongia sp.]